MCWKTKWRFAFLLPVIYQYVPSGSDRPHLHTCSQPAIANIITSLLDFRITSVCRAISEQMGPLLWLLVWIYCLTTYSFIRQGCHLTWVKEKKVYSSLRWSIFVATHSGYSLLLWDLCVSDLFCLEKRRGLELHFQLCYLQELLYWVTESVFEKQLCRFLGGMWGLIFKV